MHQTSVHVYKDAGEAKRDEKNIEVRIDERVFSADEVRELGIEVGDLFHLIRVFKLQRVDT